MYQVICKEGAEKTKANKYIILTLKKHAASREKMYKEIQVSHFFLNFCYTNSGTKHFRINFLRLDRYPSLSDFYYSKLRNQIYSGEYIHHIMWCSLLSNPSRSKQTWIVKDALFYNMM